MVLLSTVLTGSHMSEPRCDESSRADDGERIDELLTVLSDRHRRCALYALREAERAELDELASERRHDYTTGPSTNSPRTPSKAFGASSTTSICPYWPRLASSNTIAAPERFSTATRQRRSRRSWSTVPSANSPADDPQGLWRIYSDSERPGRKVLSTPRRSRSDATTRPEAAATLATGYSSPPSSPAQ